LGLVGVGGVGGWEILRGVDEGPFGEFWFEGNWLVFENYYRWVEFFLGGFDGEGGGWFGFIVRFGIGLWIFERRGEVFLNRLDVNLKGRLGQRIWLACNANYL
jgi:hypothetical protein